MRPSIPRTWASGAALSATLLLLAPALGAQITHRVSVDSAGLEGNGVSQHPDLDRAGRYVVFYSEADNLVAGDTNGVGDAFLHDRTTKTTVRLSVSTAGLEGNQDSYSPFISADGNRVAFSSEADNLTAGDLNGVSDVFLRDFFGGTTIRVSVSFGGGNTDGPSYAPTLSRDSQWVAFASEATNVVPGDVNGVRDCFVRDRAAGVNFCVSLDQTGAVGASADCSEPHISGSGEWVSFYSQADNLVPGDTNGVSDVFLHHVPTGATRRVSVGPGGLEGDDASFNPSISEDGRFVVFESNATNLVTGDTNAATDVFAHDRTTGITTRLSIASTGDEANGSSGLPRASALGRYVSFFSNATNLVPGDTNGVADVFVHDLARKVTHRLTLGPGAVESDQWSYDPVISGNGKIVAWMSEATNLVNGDTNGVYDVFARHRFEAARTSYGAGHPGTLGIPGLTLDANPVLGTSLLLEIGNSSPNPTNALLFVGLSDAAIPTNRDGVLLVQPAFNLGLALPAGSLQLPVDLPHLEALEGVSLYLQALEIDAGASKGISFTPGLRMDFGW